jgi:hypothetical protein
MLVEFGIHPARLGVRQLYESRWRAWEGEAAVEVQCSAEAHVERPALDLALMNTLVASKRVRLVIAEGRAAYAALTAVPNPAVRMIDASGRAAVSARKRILPPGPWAARTFWTPVRGGPATHAFRIAPLPGGFVYAIGASHHRVVGVVGWKDTIGGDRQTLDSRIRDAHADWVLDGLPSLASMNPGMVSPASVQWSTGSGAVTVGDASLARDTLSSQGLATGMSEALYAAACVSEEDDALFSLRKQEQRLAHLRALERLLATCRFAHRPNWVRYALFLREHLAAPPISRVALRGSSLVATSRPSTASAHDTSMGHANAWERA